MTTPDSFGAGALAGMLLAVGGQALHWFITPLAHPDATAAQSIAVTAQAVLSFGTAGCLIWRARRARVMAGVPAV